MATEKVVSPGVFTNEIDKSFLPAAIADIGAAIIGPTVKGPAGIPTIVTSYAEFQERFGDTFTSGSNYYTYLTSLAAKNYLKNSDKLTVVRILAGDFSTASATVSSSLDPVIVGTGLGTFATGSISFFNGTDGVVEGGVTSSYGGTSASFVENGRTVKFVFTGSAAGAAPQASSTHIYVNTGSSTHTVGTGTFPDIAASWVEHINNSSSIHGLNISASKQALNIVGITSSLKVNYQGGNLHGGPKFNDLTEVEHEYIRDKVLATQYDTVGKFDTDSFVDYVISQELAKNNEGYTRSQYWYVKEGEPDKFYMGYVWDFNHSYGAVKSELENWAFREFFAVGAVWAGYGAADFDDISSELAFLNKSEAIEKLYERWTLHRQSILNVNNLLDRVDNISSEIQTLDALSRDDSRWFYSNVQNYDEEYAYFKTWLLARLTWMDKFIPSSLAGANALWSGTGDLKGSTWGTTFEEYSHLFDTDDYSRTFIVITLPEKNKIYDLNTTKFIKFNWITSLDLFLIKGSDLINDNLYGDAFITFDIVNKITGNTLYTFASDEFWGGEKVDFPKYIWNITDIDNIEGSYYIRARYTYYESLTGPVTRPCTFDEVYSEFLCDESTDGDEGLDGTECNSDLYGEYIQDGGLEECQSEGDIIETIEYITSIPRIVYSNPVDFSIQSESELQGCTDTFAINYETSAQVDDGSCKYQEDCDEKYIISRTDVEGLRTFYVSDGYNILSYPFPFASEDIDFFDVLNASYFPNDGGTFSEFDGVTAHFEGNSYSAVFINGNWKSTNTMGFDINNIKPGMGIILELQKPGYITWSIPQSERSE